ncbi:hypothetical protein KEM48_007692 [Puccinia striiformis f. sp. tritici PST-130]|nr:hypothetical protein KEM48_007692 [Puccinia striiformis f. sp. tritici PST-130]
MDSNPSQQASDTEWVLQIIPEMGLTGDRDNSSPGQPALPRDRPASAGTVYFNRTILSKNEQCGSDEPPLCRRRAGRQVIRIPREGHLLLQLCGRLASIPKTQCVEENYRGNELIRRGSNAR